jgi:hypothetical protein
MNRHPGRRERSCWTLKTLQLRLEITDIQWILGHAHLSTTQRYLNPLTEDVIADVLAFHDRRGQAGPVRPGPVAGYRADSLRNLFGEDAL